MDGYLDNQLMLLGWLSHGMAMLVAYADAPFIISGMGMVSHGMAMPVADADGPFIISETTNKLVFGWTIVSSSFQDFAYCGTRELIFSNPVQNHGMAMPAADDNGPFIISEITNKLDFRWTIVSSSFQDFAYCGTRELIFSNPAQKFFLLCRFINRYIQIIGDRVKKVYMDGYLDNQLMLLRCLSHGMAMPVADANGRLLYLKLQTNLFLGGLLCHRLFRISLIMALVNSYSPTRPKSIFFYAVLLIDMCKLLGKGMG
ncbi:hypothetical protein CASFOL_022492 [Castilleja foliolosa]|uniref:Uncharacterized protein n=1 Tax=Castilleja foliolosa TaxID=1961234 RepID=A0ABD3CYI7_9LAMI